MIEGHHFIALLPVGGAGTRLWPVSNEATPKQFLRLLGDRSLFQMTVERLEQALIDEVIVVTGGPYAEQVRQELRELGKSAQVIVEPARRDSAPAIAAGTAWALRTHGPDCVLAVLPADHFIAQPEQFCAKLVQAAALASQDWIVTLSVKPTGATSEYGYIERGDPIPGEGEPSFQVRRFHEKPSAAVAETYVADPSFGWNSGMFVFTAGLFAAEAERHMPDIWRQATAAVDASADKNGMLCLDSASFEAAPRRSLDYALLEKSRRVATIPVEFGWRDIGNWNSVYGALVASEGDNVVVGDVAADAVSGSLIYAHGIKVAVHGLRDVVVIASPNGVFVAPRERAAEVKRLIAG
jgi:mannose-1-phosphate guanylyltransferase/mannose-6-phosphate isomerase